MILKNYPFLDIKKKNVQAWHNCQCNSDTVGACRCDDCFLLLLPSFLVVQNITAARFSGLCAHYFAVSASAQKFLPEITYKVKLILKNQEQSSLKNWCGSLSNLELFGVAEAVHS